MEKVNLQEKLALFSEYWCPKIVGELNDFQIKLAKFKGEFVWHKHENEDEFFYVIKGQLIVRLRDRDIQLNPGEFFIVPKGVEHITVAPEEVHALLLGPKSTINTGNVDNERTHYKLEKI